MAISILIHKTSFTTVIYYIDENFKVKVLKTISLTYEICFYQIKIVENFDFSQPFWFRCKLQESWF